jgi:hypothetical protein
MTLGAGRSDNCSSIAVYPLVPLMVEKKTVDRKRKSPAKRSSPHRAPPYGAKPGSRDRKRSSDGLPTYCSAVKHGTVLMGKCICLFNKMNVRPTGVLIRTEVGIEVPHISIDPAPNKFFPRLALLRSPRRCGSGQPWVQHKRAARPI